MMLVDCETCKLIDKCDQEDRWYGCINYKPRPQTNADRIRAMTDNELAEFLYDKVCEGEAGYPQFDTLQGWVNWLKQESKE